jgi:sugar phosphate isomerase/epimerase
MTTRTADNLGYTAQEIRARLAASTAAFDRESPIGAREIAAIREAGITRIEVLGLRAPSHFNYRDRSQVSEIMRETESQGISIVSMHGPGVSYNSDDEAVRKGAVEEALVAARVAEEMGAGVMVCHFGADEQSEKTVIEMLEGLDGSTLKLADENGQELADYMALIDRVGSDRFGMVVDVGHTKDGEGVNPFVDKDRARGTLAQCGSRLIHLHLHDFTDRDHIAPLEGDLQWDEVFAALRDIDYQGLFMFEALFPARGPELAPEYVMRKTAEFPEEFVRRYGAM